MDHLPSVCADCGGFLRSHSCDLRRGVGVLWCTRERRFLVVPLEGAALMTCSMRARWNQASGTVPWPWEAERFLTLSEVRQMQRAGRNARRRRR